MACHITQYMVGRMVEFSIPNVPSMDTVEAYREDNGAKIGDRSQGIVGRCHSKEGHSRHLRI